MLVVLLVLEGLSFTWLILLCDRVLPLKMWQLYASAIAGTSFCFTLAPLFFEYTAELAYPVPEGLIGGFLTCGNNVVAGLFLSAFFIHGIGTIWMNYVIVASAIGEYVAANQGDQKWSF